MIRTNNLALVAFTLVFIVGTSAQDKQVIDAELASPDEDGKTLWYDAQLLSIEGQGWMETKSDYDRLPARAEGVVREAVWNLSRHSAGLSVRFVTDATSMKARWTLTSANLAMPHMPATGVSGVDLYVRDDEGDWRWLACGRPSAQSTTTNLVSGIPEGVREYMLYFPLYNGVTKVEIGISQDRRLIVADPRPADFQKPLVFYGTSITHGACASRPGMPHPAILGRRFERPVINLGFSGNGRMETEVAKLMAEIDAAVFIIDCLPNINAATVLANTAECVSIIRDRHPTTPILLVEDRTYGDAFLVTSKAERNRTSREALRTVFDELKETDKHLYYLAGDHLLGDDNEGTVDSSHPTDLGFMRHADAFADALGPILQPHD